MIKLIYLKSELKSDFFDVSIGIKIPFFRVSVTIEPGRSLLTVRCHELFENRNRKKKLTVLSRVLGNEKNISRIFTFFTFGFILIFRMCYF